MGHDIDFFARRYAQGQAFGVFEKPLVIWSGTWRFSRAEIAGVTRDARRSLLLLASERNVDGYRRVADLVDGNAYYWGSVDPSTYPGYPEKLAGMGDAIMQTAACGSRRRRRGSTPGSWAERASSSATAGRPSGRSSTRRRGRDRTRWA